MANTVSAPAGVRLSPFMLPARFGAVRSLWATCGALATRRQAETLGAPILRTSVPILLILAQPMNAHCPA